MLDSAEQMMDHIQFLPQGEGPIILIMGGIAMLAFSLFLALLSPRTAGPARLMARPMPAGYIQPARSRQHAARSSRRRVQPTTPSPAPAEAVPATVFESVLIGQAAKEPKPTVNAGFKPPATMHETVLTAEPEREADWFPAIEQAAIAAGFGKPRLLGAEHGRHAVILTGCRTCAEGRAKTGCDKERDILERALRHVAPVGKVVEASCRPHQAGTCIFEILPGGTR
jgi:hypothetical protein